MVIDSSLESVITGECKGGRVDRVMVGSMLREGVGSLGDYPPPW